jgi:hypothetical protein
MNRHLKKYRTVLFSSIISVYVLHQTYDLNKFQILNFVNELINEM